MRVPGRLRLRGQGRGAGAVAEGRRHRHGQCGRADRPASGQWCLWPRTLLGDPPVAIRDSPSRCPRSSDVKWRVNMAATADRFLCFPVDIFARAVLADGPMCFSYGNNAHIWVGNASHHVNKHVGSCH